MFVCSSILLLHEMGHFLLGIHAGCKNIRLVLLDSELGTYTEMVCPKEQPFYFSFAGAFLFVIPFILSFLLLENFLEKNLFFVGLGFNFIIAITDFPAITALQILGFSIGFCMISYGEMVLIDKLLFFYKGD
ncbi:MAG: hypothetical protein QXU74_01080 [Candidatus Aenigmatarchaeota archaeon]